MDVVFCFWFGVELNDFIGVVELDLGYCLWVGLIVVFGVWMLVSVWCIVICGWLWVLRGLVCWMLILCLTYD